MIKYIFHILQQSRTHLLTRLVVLLVLVCGVVQEGYGQDQVRKYATRQRTFTDGLLGLGGSVTNPNYVINKNVNDATTLGVLLNVLGLTYAESVVDFNPNPNATNANNSPTYPAGTAITVKLSLPSELLGLLTGIEIQAISNLERGGVIVQTWDYDNRGNIYTDANLLSLLSGAGQSEITITPNQSFQGIRVRISSLLGIAGSIDFFHAYIMEDSPGSLDCVERNKAIDVLSGTRSTALDLLTSLGGVLNPYNTTNGNVTNYATMNVGVGALNTIYLNTIFQTASVPGQRARIILEDPGNLLDLGLLSQFKIQPYLRDVPAGPELASSSPLLSLRLLPGTTKYELSYQIDQPFDRIELRFDNTVTALTSLRVYEVSRLPRLMLIEDPNLLNNTLTGCGSVNLQNAIANFSEHYEYRYYTTSSGGTALPSSIVENSGTYYIEAVDPASGCASSRVAVTVTVHQIPTITLNVPNAICEGEATNTILAYTAITNNPNQYSITWAAGTPTGFNNITNAILPANNININIPASATAGTYNATLTVRNSTTGCESIEYPITIEVIPTSGRANISITNVNN